MRLKIRLNSEESVKLPVHYNFTLQGFIYNYLDPVLSKMLHENGIPYRKRQYKLFTFSQIFPANMSRERDYWIMTPPLDFYVSAYDEKILESFALCLIRNKNIRLGRNVLAVESIGAIVPPNYRENIVIKTLSPITIHSTVTKEDRRFTHYYSPFENKFSEMLRENLRRKFVAVHGVFPEEGEDFFSIVPLDVRKKPVIIRYKGFVIAGWKGLFELRTSPSYFHIAYKTGLGARNSIGFGMWKPVSEIAFPNE